ncbi:MAG TPA: hypothetical protein VLM05_20260 [Mycobacteriales bacterium]|nr:hypothetical protein [Mycobacteriales bacterium]
MATVTGELRRVSRGTKTLLRVFVALTAVATLALYGFAGSTEDWFSWTIRPPLTAAFLGAGYAAGFVLVVLGLRARSWAQARAAVVTVAVFAALTLIATLLHLDKFHFGAGGVVARFAAWFWLAVYVTVPVALVALIVHQQRAAGSDPERRDPVPAWLVAAFALQGLVMLVVGAALFVAPATARTLWPWPLTPLTARVVAAWLIAFAVAAVLTVLERDLDRLAAGTVAYTVLGVLELLALARFAGQARWDSAAGIAYLVVLVSVVPVGAAGWLAAARARRRPVADATPAAAAPAG